MKESPVAAVADASTAATDRTEPAARGGAGVPGSMEAEVAKVIAAVRPAVQADRGDIELISVDTATGIVEVELSGACTSCPASSQTLKAGVERIMMDRIPGVTEVINIGPVLFDDGTAVSL